MKSRILTLLLGLAFSMPALAAAPYVLGVKGVACPYCAFGVEKRLNQVDGVTDVEVDIGDSVVRVTMAEGTRLTEAQARRAVEDAGFTLDTFSSGTPDAR